MLQDRQYSGKIEGLGFLGGEFLLGTLTSVALSKRNPSVTGGERLSLRAERSNLLHRQNLDCVVVSLLAMTQEQRFPGVAD